MTSLKQKQIILLYNSLNILRMGIKHRTININIPFSILVFDLLKCLYRNCYINNIYKHSSNKFYINITLSLFNNVISPSEIILLNMFSFKNYVNLKTLRNNNFFFKNYDCILLTPLGIKNKREACISKVGGRILCLIKP